MIVPRIPALTVKQPWASLLMLTDMNRKDVENRTWSRSYRGPLIIHAGTGVDRDGYPDALRAGLDVTALPRGACLGVVTLTEIVTGHPSRWALPGHLHWVTTDPVAAFPKPLPCRGQLGLWTPPAAALILARALTSSPP
jgi:hypothetical protein